jgi:hypothetical protein
MSEVTQKKKGMEHDTKTNTMRRVDSRQTANDRRAIINIIVTLASLPFQGFKALVAEMALIDFFFFKQKKSILRCPAF